MPDWRTSLQKITTLIYLLLFIGSWKWRELRFLAKPMWWEPQMGTAERSHPGSDGQKGSSRDVGASGSRSTLLPTPLPGPFLTQQIRPGRISGLWWGATQPFLWNTISKFFSVASPYPLSFFSPSNLPSFVNISWTAYMHSGTKILLIIETIPTLHCYATSCTRSFCFSSLVSLLPKGKCINGKEENSCLQAATRTRTWCVNYQHW